MKKNLFYSWLMFTAILFTANIQAQMTVGGKKAPENFSVLELLNKGGLRLPQMTTAERDAFAVKNNDKGNGLTIYNKTTNCVEYWNASRWVSLCDGTSQATISPEPCVNVAADGTGCNDTFKVTDPDCPNGPFTIAITGGGTYAYLSSVDENNGSFKINFNANETVNKHTVIVRVTSTCTGLFKEFLFSQNGVDCSSMSYAVPALSASSSVLCANGSVYLSVPANTPNLDKLIWTINGDEIFSNRGLNYLIATKAGRYNVSMGAVGCNTNAANEKNIGDSTTAAPANISILASNNGVICGSGSVTLSASGTGTIAWFHNGVEDKSKSGAPIDISGDSNVGEWFAAVKDGTCYSKQSNIINVTKSAAGGSISLPDADVLVNDKPLKTFTAFCAEGTLNLSVANKQAGITYTWYNGNDPITVNPFIVPSSQSKISLRMVATDNSGAKCPAQQQAIDMNVIQGNTPSIVAINGRTKLCGGEATLSIQPKESGSYTYTWYKNNVIITGETADTFVAKEGGVTYGATIKNATGCISPMFTIAVASGDSNVPEVFWKPEPPATAVFGAEITFGTDSYFNPTTYVWTMNGVTLSNTGANAKITLPASGAKATITVTAKNDCGSSQILVKEIALSSGCLTPIIRSQSASSQTITAGSNVKVEISLTDGNAQTYQWYQNSTKSLAGATTVGTSASSYSTSGLAVGKYYFYCIVTNGCTGNPTATSEIFEVIASPNPKDLLAGSGTFSGKICFDIAESNYNNECGALISRGSQKADFNLGTVNTQKYTFTPSPSSPVSNVRFVCVESLSGQIVSSVSGDKQGAVSAPIEATVVYKTSLSTGANGQGTAFGKTTANALSVIIYAIYNDKLDGSGTDRQLQLKAQIKDCACCGAMISDKVWKEFMCYNLGAASTSKDPLTPDVDIVGGLYMFGSTSMTGPINYAAWKPTIVGSKVIKAAGDPCPAGYRVPIYDELEGLYNYNLKTVKGNTTDNTPRGVQGVMFGPALMLPNGGGYYAPSINNNQGKYLSSTSTGTGLAGALYVRTGYIAPMLGANALWAGSIRCISEN